MTEEKYLVRATHGELPVCIECARGPLGIDTVGMAVKPRTACAVCGSHREYCVTLAIDQVPEGKRKLAPQAPPPPPAWRAGWERCKNQFGPGLLYEAEMGMGFADAIEHATKVAIRAAYKRGWEDRERMAAEETQTELSRSERAQDTTPLGIERPVVDDDD